MPLAGSGAVWARRPQSRLGERNFVKTRKFYETKFKFCAMVSPLRSSLLPRPASQPPGRSDRLDGWCCSPAAWPASPLARPSHLRPASSRQVPLWACSQQPREAARQSSTTAAANQAAMSMTSGTHEHNMGTGGPLRVLHPGSVPYVLFIMKRMSRVACQIL